MRTIVGLFGLALLIMALVTSLAPWLEAFVGYPQPSPGFARAMALARQERAACPTIELGWIGQLPGDPAVRHLALSATVRSGRTWTDVQSLRADLGFHAVTTDLTEESPFAQVDLPGGLRWLGGEVTAGEYRGVLLDPARSSWLALVELRPHGAGQIATVPWPTAGGTTFDWQLGITDQAGWFTPSTADSVWQHRPGGISAVLAGYGQKTAFGGNTGNAGNLANAQLDYGVAQPKAFHRLVLRTRLTNAGFRAGISGEVRVGGRNSPHLGFTVALVNRDPRLVTVELDRGMFSSDDLVLAPGDSIEVTAIRTTCISPDAGVGSAPGASPATGASQTTWELSIDGQPCRSLASESVQATRPGFRPVLLDGLVFSSWCRHGSGQARFGPVELTGQ